MIQAVPTREQHKILLATLEELLTFRGNPQSEMILPTRDFGWFTVARNEANNDYTIRARSASSRHIEIRVGQERVHTDIADAFGMAAEYIGIVRLIDLLPQLRAGHAYRERDSVANERAGRACGGTLDSLRLPTVGVDEN